MSQGPASDRDRGLSSGGVSQGPLDGKTPSAAPNNAFATGAGDDLTGFDSPPITSSQLGNTDVDAQSTTGDQGDLTWPPGGGPDADGPRGRNTTEDAYRKN